MGQPLIQNPTEMTLEDRIVVLEKMLLDLKMQLQFKTLGDNVMMARIREELDMILNCKKEDRLTNTTSAGSGKVLRKQKG